ncbi:MAG: ATP-binding cassette domain-containing protein [Lachnospiraceae bacterium]|jgi:ABC-type multidrug transport system ATPase subunit|nr:ATP-binding cassette domain-containing protein [Lachnospiraceae bacterium]
MILQVEGIQKNYQKPLFSPVSFILDKGEGLAISGHNGSGKTTLLDMIAGLCKPSAGVCRRHTKLGYVMNLPGFQESLSCYDNLMTEAYLCGLKQSAAKEQVLACMAQCDMLSYAHQKYKKCSAGMKARVSIAAALLGDPGLLLLDEAFNALDIETVNFVKTLLLKRKAIGTSIIMISHNRTDFDGLCERLLLLPDAEMRSL